MSVVELLGFNERAGLFRRKIKPADTGVYLDNGAFVSLGGGLFNALYYRLGF